MTNGGDDQPRSLARDTAHRLLSRGQKVVLLATGATLGVTTVIAGAHSVLTMIISYILIPFWVVFVGEKLLLWWASVFYRAPGTQRLIPVDDAHLPTYSILVPLYQEAAMLPGLAAALDGLIYPRDRLQILFVLEEDDTETRDAVEALNLPPYFYEVVVPPLGPRTKPKACDVAMRYATGECTVIYDAEDIPDADQLLKATTAFRALPDEVVCLQARLAFTNNASSWVARFYWAEYIIHFEWILAGFAKLRLVPPLGGTSNHFRTTALEAVAIHPRDMPDGQTMLGAWDPWNVTEDADIAAWLARHGYKVELLDSVTREQAPVELRAATRQRRRWLKGYTQTGLVHTRRPLNSIRQMGLPNYLAFNLLMLGTPVALVLTPLSWLLTFSYVGLRIGGASQAAGYIEDLFTPWAFYAGTVMMVIGNAVLVVQLLAACFHRQQHGHVKHLLAVFAWWLCTSVSAITMVWQLLRPSTRYEWEKTEHTPDPKVKDPGELAPIHPSPARGRRPLTAPAARKPPGS